MPPTRWIVVPLLTILVVGCDGPLTVSQRLAGEWVGRPETAAERTLREWPGRRGEDGNVDPENPEIVAAIEKALATDLEAVGPMAIQMRLDELGSATLELNGQQALEGIWSLTAVEGRRAQLEVSIDADGESEAEAGAEPTRRRFTIEFLRTGEAFVLQEIGADPRFGRLLFQRSGAAPAAE